MKLAKQLTLASMEAADITDTSRSPCTMVCTSPANGVDLLHSSNLKRCLNPFRQEKVRNPDQRRNNAVDDANDPL